MLKMTEIILLLFIWLTGACVFSFADAAAWRMSRGMDFIKDRSRCDSCGHVLAFWETIPVVGWILCRGRCRCCGRPVSLRHMAAELIGGGAALLCADRMGISLESVWMLAFLGILMTAALVDLDTMEIPEGIHCVILVLTALSFLSRYIGLGNPEILAADSFELSLLSRAAGALCVSVPMLLLTAAVPGAFGGGDIKLSAVCGLFLGWKGILMSMIFAVLSAGAWGGILLAGRKAGRKDHFAFAPFLCAGVFVSVFWGVEIWNWYKGILMI